MKKSSGLTVFIGVLKTKQTSNTRSDSDLRTTGDSSSQPTKSDFTFTFFLFLSFFFWGFGFLHAVDCLGFLSPFSPLNRFPIQPASHLGSLPAQTNHATLLPFALTSFGVAA